MKKISKNESVAITEKKLLKLRTKLEGRLKVMDVAMVSCSRD